jgi:hypothetical protein
MRDRSSGVGDSRISFVQIFMLQGRPGPDRSETGGLIEQAEKRAAVT